MKIIKWGILGFIVMLVMVALIAYIGLRASLPKLSGAIDTSSVVNTVNLSRDTIGTAIVNAHSQEDAAYALGYAHAQDRLFQMDLLRRQAAGELSEIVGEKALNVDKKHRIHQFRAHAISAFDNLSQHEQAVLVRYSAGVNDAAQSLSMKPFEYILTGSEFSPWVPADSLLASYSMYIDLQLAQTEIDYRLTVVKALFGDTMHTFFTLPSNYQAAIDNSVVDTPPIVVPFAPKRSAIDGNVIAGVNYYDSIVEQPDYGSNNWAVAGRLTGSQSALLSNDMHLGLNVPAIWYRAQLNYKHNGQDVSVTGVSLPGTPAIIVGSNTHVAWGFTNSNVDNVDWVKLDETSSTQAVSETILTPDSSEVFTFEMSEYGPVREFKGQRYALKWIAHQPYAVNIRVADMAHMTNMQDGLALAKAIRIPAQNMVIADKSGQIAWQLTGAMSERKPLARHAITEAQYSALWNKPQLMPANQLNPKSGRVWTANARVIGTKDLPTFGDGGYALGARQLQIMKLLMAQEVFEEQDFYDIQLNNEALFLAPWYTLLSNTLASDPQKYAQDIAALQSWGACACPDSVGYTLVRKFRSAVINQLIAPVNDALKEHDLSTSYLLRSIEPAVWALINQRSGDWLPTNVNDYNELMLIAYNDTKERLLTKYSTRDNNLADLTWGKVNTLKVKHPFSATLGPLSGLVDMPEMIGHGDSYLPAVQSTNFGASQRLIVRPGDEEKAILTVPGGQSGHFMSPYYDIGFTEFAAQANTPLLPQAKQHEIIFSPVAN